MNIFVPKEVVADEVVTAGVLNTPLRDAWTTAQLLFSENFANASVNNAACAEPRGKWLWSQEGRVRRTGAAIGVEYPVLALVDPIADNADGAEVETFRVRTRVRVGAPPGAEQVRVRVYQGIVGNVKQLNVLDVTLSAHYTSLPAWVLTVARPTLVITETYLGGLTDLLEVVYSARFRKPRFA